MYRRLAGAAVVVLLAQPFQIWVWRVRNSWAAAALGQADDAFDDRGLAVGFNALE